VVYQPVVNLLEERLLSHDIVQMDETTVQVLKESGKRAQSTSYLWLQRGGPPDKPVVRFHYDPGRGAKVAKRLLEGFTGYLQTDGYDGYNAAVAANRLTHVGCWAHYPESAVIRSVRREHLRLLSDGRSFVQIRWRCHPYPRAGVVSSDDHAFRGPLETADGSTGLHTVSIARCKARLAP